MSLKIKDGTRIHQRGNGDGDALGDAAGTAGKSCKVDAEREQGGETEEERP